MVFSKQGDAIYLEALKRAQYEISHEPVPEYCERNAKTFRQRVGMRAARILAETLTMFVRRRDARMLSNDTITEVILNTLKKRPSRRPPGPTLNPTHNEKKQD